MGVDNSRTYVIAYLFTYVPPPSTTLLPQHVSGAENEAERAKTRVERSGAVSGSENNRAERSESGGGIAVRGVD